MITPQQNIHRNEPNAPFFNKFFRGGHAFEPLNMCAVDITIM